MATYIHLADLLPPLYDRVVLENTSKRLLAIERSSIGFALINSVRWAAINQLKPHVHPQDAQGITKITTSDRFSNEQIPRADIVQRIRHTSGLDDAMSDTALFMIEWRVDLALVAGPVSIEGVGSIETNSRGQRTSEYRKMVENAFAELSERASRPSTTDFILALQNALFFRRPCPYQITLAKSLGLTPDDREATIPEREEGWKQKHRFSWD